MAAETSRGASTRKNSSTARIYVPPYPQRPTLSFGARGGVSVV